MGMFDYVTHEGRRYQTNDTPDQYLSEYRIVNGRLLGDEWHFEAVPKGERPYPDAPDDSIEALFGSMRRVIDKADVDLNWHGYLDMVPDWELNEEWVDYRAKFTDGNLVSFERLPSSAGESRGG